MSKKDIMNGKTLPLASAKASSAPSAKGDATLVDVVSSRAASEARPRKRVSSPPASKAEPPAVVQAVVQAPVPPPAPSKARVSSPPKASKVSRASVPPSRTSSRDLSAASLAGSGSVQRKRANRISKAPPALASSPSVAPASAPRVEVKETLLPASPVLMTPSAPAPSSRRTGDQTLFGQTSSVPSSVSGASASPSIAFDKTVAIAGAIKAPTEDEISIPPASDLEEHDRFFVEGELAEKAAREQARAQALRPNGVITGEHEMIDPRLLLLASPAARARRAKYEKWVKVAVGVSAVLCLAALVRGAVARSSHDPETSALAATNEVHAIHAEPTQAAQATPQPVSAAQPANAPAEPAPAPQAASPQAVPVAPPAVETTSATSPAPAANVEPARAAATAAASDAPTETAAVSVSDKTAPEEKKAARIALERGKAKDAIAAGERSVALDPTDGEAWLILGAAYQEAGKGGEARRCFNACLKQGKKGPIGECRSMLQ